MELILRKNPAELIENRLTLKDGYFSDTAAANATTGTKGRKEISNIQLEITDIFMNYEAFAPDYPMAMSKKALFPLDVYESQYTTFQQGSSSYYRMFRLKKSTSLLYFLILKDHQYYLNPNQKKSLSTFSVFPSDLSGIEFFMKGEKIVFPDGLKQLNVNNYDSDSQKIYYKYLTNRGLVDDSLEDFFGKSSTSESLQQAFLLDLTTHKEIQGGTELGVQINFTGSLKDNSYRLVLISVMPGEIQEESAKNQDGYSYWKFTSTGDP